MKKKQLHIGGQAVIEGVMMRCGERIATAVRKGDEIKVVTETITPLTKRYKILSYPFLRGFASLMETVYYGTKSLLFSANESGDDDEKLTGLQVSMTMGVSILLSIGLFVLFPYFLTYLVGIEESAKPILFNLIDGVFKLAILIIYIYLIGRMDDMKRIFQYHGAEHQAVHAFEHQKRLTPKNAAIFPTAHPRCGTSFLMIVILTGVFVFSFIPAIATVLLPINSYPAFLRYLILFCIRLLFMPIIAGISYEWLKLSPRFAKRSIIRYLNLPGIWIQKLTTRIPDTQQLEVAIAALKAVLPKERSGKKGNSSSVLT